MQLSLKRVALIALIAFIIGSIPSISTVVKKYTSFSSETGFSVHSLLLSALAFLADMIRKYAWHILIAYTVIIAGIIFMENQNPDRTMAWLITLALLPVVGLLIYVFIGPEFSFQKTKKLYRQPKLLPLPQSDTSGNNRFLLERLIYASSGAEILLRNKIAVFVRGEDKYTALKNDLRKAEHCVNMQYFAIKDDEVGLEIGDILAERAKSGVKVRLLYDAVGSWKLSRGFLKRLTCAGVECHSFMPMSFPRLRRRMNFRNHRKIVVIDDAVAYTGGFNVGMEYIGKGPLGWWRDTHVRLEGEAVYELNKIFLRDWCFRSGKDPAQFSDFSAVDLCEPLVDASVTETRVLPLQVVTSGVNSPWHPISQGYFNMISRARERVWITSPYLVPGAGFIRTMTNTSLAGVDVRILTTSAKDHFLTFWGSRSNYEDLLRAGVRIFLYKKGFIHAKTMLSDDDTCSVGTCNMDARSLEINFENQLFIYDRELNDEFAAQFEKDLEDSQEIMLEEWKNRPFFHKIIESFARLYSSQI